MKKRKFSMLNLNFPGRVYMSRNLPNDKSLNFSKLKIYFHGGYICLYRRRNEKSENFSMLNFYIPGMVYMSRTEEI